MKRDCEGGDRSLSDICYSGLAWHTEETTLRQKFEEFGVVDEAVRVDLLVGLIRPLVTPIVGSSQVADLCVYRRLSSRIAIRAAAAVSASSATPTRMMRSAPSQP